MYELFPFPPHAADAPAALARHARSRGDARVRGHLVHILSR